jgi:hypothetical protein
MNKIEDEINFNEAIDYQFTEVKTPRRKFNNDISYLLKYADTDNSYLPVFQNNKGVFNSGFKTNENTKTIEIKGLPLPLLNRNNVNTAYAIDKDDSKLFLVLYYGVNEDLNVTSSDEPLLLPALHQNYWQKWFKFRINATSFNWSFTAFAESIAFLNTKNKIFAYKRWHIIKNINRKEIKPNLFEVDLETDTLP